MNQKLHIILCNRRVIQMERNLLIKWFFPHPPELVWEFLTDSDRISEWLMKTDFKPVMGHKFKFKSKPIPQMGWDGIVYCEVVEIVPFKKLAYTWKGGPEPGVTGLDTLLTWTVTPRDAGTEVLLEHTGFKGWKNYLASLFMERGWRRGVPKRLLDLLNKHSFDKA